MHRLVVWTKIDVILFPRTFVGTFGLVLLAHYRGTQVAVKRVIPPKSAKADGDKSGGSKNDGKSTVSSGMQSGLGVSGHSSWGGMSLTHSSKSSGTLNPLSSMKASAMTSMIFGKGVAQQQTEAAMLRKLKAEFIEEMRYLSRYVSEGLTGLLVSRVLYLFSLKYCFLFQTDFVIPALPQ